MYDKNVIFTACVHAVQAADYHLSDNNFELEKEMKGRLYEGLEGKLIGVEEPEITVKVSKKKVTAQVETKLGVPEDVMGISKLSKLEVKVEKKRIDPVESISDIRRIKAIYDLTKELVEE